MVIQQPQEYTISPPFSNAPAALSSTSDPNTYLAQIFQPPVLWSRFCHSTGVLPPRRENVCASAIRLPFCNSAPESAQLQGVPRGCKYSVKKPQKNTYTHIPRVSFETACIRLHPLHTNGCTNACSNDNKGWVRPKKKRAPERDQQHHTRGRRHPAFRFRPQYRCGKSNGP